MIKQGAKYSVMLWLFYADSAVLVPLLFLKEFIILHVRFLYLTLLGSFVLPLNDNSGGPMQLCCFFLDKSSSEIGAGNIGSTKLLVCC